MPSVLIVGPTAMQNSSGGNRKNEWQERERTPKTEISR